MQSGENCQELAVESVLIARTILPLRSRYAGNSNLDPQKLNPSHDKNGCL